MTPEQIFKNENIYFGKTTINGIECTIGYIKKFRWSWVATQLNIFIIIGKTDAKIDLKMIFDFSTSCFNFAKNNNKGWPRGIQSGIGSIAILQGNDIEFDASLFCSNLSRKHWSAFEIPVLYNTNDKTTIKYTSNPIWGMVYFPFFTETINRITKKLGDL